MSNEGMEITTPLDCLQANGNIQNVQQGGYWFEIIEIDEPNELKLESQSHKAESISFINEKNKSPSCFKGPLADCVWTDLPWNCVTCSQVFYSAEQLIEHSKNVHGVRFLNIEWVCPDCPLKFRHYDTLINHIRRVYRENLALICDICDKKCDSFKDLDDHRRDKHRYGCMPILRHCETCGHCCRSEYYLRIHVQSIHTQKGRDLPFDCSICNKNYRSKSALAEHQLLHGTPKFCCEQCGKKFARKFYLDKHILIHNTNRSYQCRLCTKTLKTRAGLTVHLQSHSKKKTKFSRKSSNLTSIN